MRGYEQMAMLTSAKILVDSREKQTEQSVIRYRSFDTGWQRATLNYGDYAVDAVLPSGMHIYNLETSVSASCVIERKMSLDELGTCLFSRQPRLEREFARARRHGAKIYLLVENGSWEQIQVHNYRHNIEPERYMSRLIYIIAKYDLHLVFCPAYLSGELINRILMRELTLAIERGDYDGTFGVCSN
jgi:ERCC4-type nuclease